MASPPKHYAEAQLVFQSQIAALQDAEARIQAGFNEAVDIILKATGAGKKVVTTGLGKSGIIAHKIAATLMSTGTTTVFLHACEALHGDVGMVSHGDVVMMFSNSATTAELIQMIPRLRVCENKLIGVFGSKCTPLAQQMDVVLDAGVQKEACPIGLAPTSSTTVALVIGDALAAALMRARQFRQEDFGQCHPAGALGKKLLTFVEDVMHTNNVPTCKMNVTLRDALRMILQSSCGVVVVVDDEDRPQAAVCDADVQKCLLQAEDLSIPIEGIIRKAVPVLQNDSQMRLSDALERLGPQVEAVETVFGGVAIVDAQGMLAGWVTWEQLLQKSQTTASSRASGK